VSFSPADRIVALRLTPRIRRVRDSRLVRQNLVLFIGGISAGLASFIYQAVAGRALGPRDYGAVASLVALYTMGMAVNLILVVTLARFTAGLMARDEPAGVPHILLRSGSYLAIPGLVFVLGIAALSPLVAAFLHLESPVPVIWLGVALVLCWYMALPRGALQGLQRFGSLSLNNAFELITRTLALGLLLALGLGVNGAVIALLVGAGAAGVLGVWSLRQLLRLAPAPVSARPLLRFALTAMAGTIGVILLFNADVVLAKHYLDAHGAGIYGGLNKIGLIVYFGTLSVSQVLFPRVVEAVAKQLHPGRLLLLSAGLILAVALCVVAVAALVPWLIVAVLFGSAFSDASGYVLPVTCIGLAIALCNLLVQFFMAVHDRAFIPVLGAGCALEVGLIAVFHADVGSVVRSVLISVIGLLIALVIRALVLMPRLRPEMVAPSDDGASPTGPL
jgi:O-antigen/teichoic acid export membrane protein